LESFEILYIYKAFINGDLIFWESWSLFNKYQKQGKLVVVIYGWIY